MNTPISFFRKFYMNFIILSLNVIYITLYTMSVFIIDILFILFFFILLTTWQKIKSSPILTMNFAFFNLLKTFLTDYYIIFYLLILFLSGIIFLLLIFYLLKKTHKKIDILSEKYMNLLITNKRQIMLIQLLCNVIRWFMTAFAICLSQLWLLYIFILFVISNLNYDITKDIKNIFILMSITNILLYILLFFYYTDTSCIIMIVYTIINIHMLALCCVNVLLKKSLNYLLELV